MKKVHIKKNEAQNGVRIFWQIVMFWAENFFQRPLENFLRVESECCMYQKGAPNVALYARKKIRNIRHTNHEILAEMWKKKLRKNITWVVRNENFFLSLTGNFAILEIWIFGLLACLKNFLWELHIHSWYLKHSPISRE